MKSRLVIRGAYRYTNGLLRRALHASSSSQAKIAFVGLGNMGLPMAKCLLAAGHELSVFDVAAAPLTEMRALGATTAASPAAAATLADAVVTMLPSSPHVREVYEGSIMSSARAGTLLIDCSTIDPGVSRALSSTAASRRLRMIDAPVSGGVGGAQAGTLTFMVGGAADDFEAARPLLAAMGKSIVHCGAAGSGQVAKLCNNLVLGVSMNVRS